MDYTVTATNSDGMEEGTASVDVDAKEATISGLTAYTQYTVSVAAVNSAGTAPPTTLSVETPGEYVACKAGFTIIIIMSHCPVAPCQGTRISIFAASITLQGIYCYVSFSNNIGSLSCRFPISHRCDSSPGWSH